ADFPNAEPTRIACERAALEAIEADDAVRQWFAGCLGDYDADDTSGLRRQEGWRKHQRERDGAGLHGFPGVSESPGVRDRNRYECALWISRDSVYSARAFGSIVCTTRTFAIIGTDGKIS